MDFENAATGLKAIAHSGRLQILCALVGKEQTVGELARVLQISQSSVSQHLGRMKAAGILEDRRSGNQVYYSMKKRGYEEVVTALCRIYTT